MLNRRYQCEPPRPEKRQIRLGMDYYVFSKILRTEFFSNAVIANFTFSRRAYFRGCWYKEVQEERRNIFRLTANRKSASLPSCPNALCVNTEFVVFTACPDTLNANECSVVSATPESSFSIMILIASKTPSQIWRLDPGYARSISLNLPPPPSRH